MALAACAPQASPSPAATTAPAKPATAASPAAAEPATAASPAAAKPAASPAAAEKPAAPASSFKPSGSIELVVPYAPGGGSSITAQTINQAIQEGKILPEPFNISNKPGASGSVGLAYVVEKKGNTNVLSTGVDSGLINNKLDGNSPIDFENLTPIALLAVDNMLIATRTESPHKSMKELIDFAKANPGKLTAGGTGASGSDRITFALIEQATGAKIEYVPFNSGGEVNAALLGGHIDLAANNPNEFQPQVEAGKLRAMVSLSKNRLDTFKDTPTMVELGYPKALMFLGRGIVGPPDMPADVRKFYEEVFKKVSETTTWKDYVKKNAMTADYRDGAGYTAYLKETRELMKTLQPLIR